MSPIGCRLVTRNQFSILAKAWSADADQGLLQRYLVRESLNKLINATVILTVWSAILTVANRI